VASFLCGNCGISLFSLSDVLLGRIFYKLIMFIGGENSNFSCFLDVVYK
jgi:hypothetical protein